MRCPKCGFISFDHVEDCLKCGKNISKVSSAVEGTTYNVAAPSFLKFPQGEKIQEDEDTEITFDTIQEDYDVVDPDLDVLVDGGESEEESGDAEISFGDEFDGFSEDNDEPSNDFEIALDDDDGGEEGIDLGQFEDAFEEEQPDIEEEISLDMPDELADISDLSPPQETDEQEAPEVALKEEASPVKEDSIDDFNLDLDLESLGEEFSLSSDEDEATEDDDPLGDLSLDDLGFSTEDEVIEEKPKKEPDPMDMDADLDFDLDLGGISLEEE